MEIKVMPTVQQIFNVTGCPKKTVVMLPDGNYLPISEYVKLPSFDTIRESINDIYAVDGEVIIEMK